MSFEENDRIDDTLRGSGWRHLRMPTTLRCYVASTWIELAVIDVNDETREIRVADETVMRGLRRSVLDASQYRGVAGLFDQEPLDDVAPVRPLD
jgi:hypothetical protein